MTNKWEKFILFCTCLLVCSYTTLKAQNINGITKSFYNAVSIAYDSINGRHLISYYGSSAGLSMTDDGSGIIYLHDFEGPKYLIRAMNPKSMIIKDSILYYTVRQSICSFDLKTDSLIACYSFDSKGIDFEFDDFCIDTSNNFYLTSYLSNMLVKFNHSTNQFQTLIENSDDFTKPYGIAYSKITNKIYVASYEDASIIYRINKDSTIIEHKDTVKVSYPLDIILDSSQNFYLPNTKTGKIVKLNQSFVPDSIYNSETFYHPNQILLRNDTLWVAESSKSTFIVPGNINRDKTIMALDTLVRILPYGWNWISSCVYPYHSELDSIFGGMDSLELIKRINGDSYTPKYHINNIGDFNILEGYQLFTNLDDTIRFIGHYCDPQFITMPLNYGWNWIPYLFKEPFDVYYYLGSVDSTHVVLMKDKQGHNYIPSFGINTIGLMKPGESYQLYLNYQDTLYFTIDSVHHNSINSRAINQSLNDLSSPHSSSKRHEKLLSEKIIMDLDGSESAATIIVKGNCYNDGTEIGAFKGNNVFGKAEFSNGMAVLTVWGSGRFTKGKGATKKEILTLKIWDADKGKLKSITPTVIKNFLTNESVSDIKFDNNSVFYIEVCN